LSVLIRRLLSPIATTLDDRYRPTLEALLESRDALEGSLSDIKARMISNEKEVEQLTTTVNLGMGLAQRSRLALIAVKERHENLEAALQAVSESVRPVAALTERIGSLDQRIADLVIRKERHENLEAALQAVSESVRPVAALTERIGSLDQRIADLVIRVDEIRERVSDLGGLLADAARERTILAEAIDQTADTEEPTT